MPAITVYVDPSAFFEDVAALLKGSPIAAEFKGGKVSITAKNFSQLLRIVQAAVASVEIIKSNIIAQADPDGTKGLKFSGELAAHTAVGVLCDAVRFGGPFGWILNAIDKPILNLLIDAVMSGFKGRNWIAEAKTLLHL